jgi:hypothetical protein
LRAFDDMLASSALTLLENLALPPLRHRNVYIFDNSTVLNQTNNHLESLFDIVSAGCFTSRLSAESILMNINAKESVKESINNSNVEIDLNFSSRDIFINKSYKKSIVESNPINQTSNNQGVFCDLLYSNDKRSIKEILKSTQHRNRLSLLWRIRFQRAQFSSISQWNCLRQIYTAVSILISCHYSTNKLSQFFDDKFFIFDDLLFFFNNTSLLNTAKGNSVPDDLFALTFRIVTFLFSRADGENEDAESYVLEVMKPFQSLPQELGISKSQPLGGLLPSLLISEIDFMLEIMRSLKNNSLEEDSSLSSSSFESSSEFKRLLWTEQVLLLTMCSLRLPGAVKILSDSGIVSFIVSFLHISSEISSNSINNICRSNNWLFIYSFFVQILDELISAKRTTFEIFNCLSGFEILLKCLDVEAELLYVAANKYSALLNPDVQSLTPAPLSKSVQSLLLSLITLIDTFLSKSGSDHDQSLLKNAQFSQTMIKILSYGASNSCPILSTSLSLIVSILGLDPAPPTMCNYFLTNNVTRTAWITSITTSECIDEDALDSILDFIDSIGITEIGLNLVKSFNPFIFVMKIFHESKYLLSDLPLLLWDVPVVIGEHLKEILNHYPDLIELCLKSIIAEMNTIADLATAFCDGSSVKLSKNTGVSVSTGDMKYFNFSRAILDFLGCLLDNENKKIAIQFIELKGIDVLYRLLYVSLGSANYFHVSLANEICLPGFPTVVRSIFAVFEKLFDLFSTVLLNSFMLKIETSANILQSELKEFSKKYTLSNNSEMNKTVQISKEKFPIQNIVDSVSNDPRDLCSPQQGINNVSNSNLKCSIELEISEKNHAYTSILRNLIHVGHLIDLLNLVVKFKLDQSCCGNSESILTELFGIDKKNEDEKGKNKGKLVVESQLCRVIYLVKDLVLSCCREEQRLHGQQMEKGGVSLIYSLIVIADRLSVKENPNDDSRRICRLEKGFTFEALSKDLGMSSDDEVRFITESGYVRRLHKEDNFPQVEVLSIRENVDNVDFLPSHYLYHQGITKNAFLDGQADFSMRGSAISAFLYIESTVTGFLAQITSCFNNLNILSKNIDPIIPQCLSAVDILCEPINNIENFYSIDRYVEGSSHLSIPSLEALSTQDCCSLINGIQFCMRILIVHDVSAYKTDIWNRLIIIHILLSNNGKSFENILLSTVQIFLMSLVNMTEFNSLNSSQQYKHNFRRKLALINLEDVLSSWIELSTFVNLKNEIKDDKVFSQLNNNYKSVEIKLRIRQLMLNYLSPLWSHYLIYSLPAKLTFLCMELMKNLTSSLLSSNLVTSSSSNNSDIQISNFDLIQSKSNEKKEVELSSDNFDFIMGLDSSLREDVLISAGKDFLNTLPSSLIQEAFELGNNNANPKKKIEFSQKNFFYSSVNDKKLEPSKSCLPYLDEFSFFSKSSMPVPIKVSTNGNLFHSSTLFSFESTIQLCLCLIENSHRKVEHSTNLYNQTESITRPDFIIKILGNSMNILGAGVINKINLDENFVEDVNTRNSYYSFFKETLNYCTASTILSWLYLRCNVIFKEIIDTKKFHQTDTVSLDSLLFSIVSLLGSDILSPRYHEISPSRYEGLRLIFTCHPIFKPFYDNLMAIIELSLSELETTQENEISNSIRNSFGDEKHQWLQSALMLIDLTTQPFLASNSNISFAKKLIKFASFGVTKYKDFNTNFDFDVDLNELDINFVNGLEDELKVREEFISKIISEHELPFDITTNIVTDIFELRRLVSVNCVGFCLRFIGLIDIFCSNIGIVKIETCRSINLLKICTRLLSNFVMDREAATFFILLDGFKKLLNISIRHVGFPAAITSIVQNCCENDINLREKMIKSFHFVDQDIISKFNSFYKYDPSKIMDVNFYLKRKPFIQLLPVIKRHPLLFLSVMLNKERLSLSSNNCNTPSNVENEEINPYFSEFIEKIFEKVFTLSDPLNYNNFLVYKRNDNSCDVFLNSNKCSILSDNIVIIADLIHILPDHSRILLLQLLKKEYSFLNNTSFLKFIVNSLLLTSSQRVSDSTSDSHLFKCRASVLYLCASIVTVPGKTREIFISILAKALYDSLLIINTSNKICNIVSISECLDFITTSNFKGKSNSSSDFYDKRSNCYGNGIFKIPTVDILAGLVAYGVHFLLLEAFEIVNSLNDVNLSQCIQKIISPLQSILRIGIPRALEVSYNSEMESKTSSFFDIENFIIENKLKLNSTDQNSSVKEEQKLILQHFDFNSVFNGSHSENKINLGLQKNAKVMSCSFSQVEGDEEGGDFSNTNVGNILNMPNILNTPLTEGMDIDNVNNGKLTINEFCADLFDSDSFLNKNSEDCSVFSRCSSYFDEDEEDEDSSRGGQSSISSVNSNLFRQIEEDEDVQSDTDESDDDSNSYEDDSDEESEFGVDDGSDDSDINSEENTLYDSDENSNYSRDELDTKWRFSANKNLKDLFESSSIFESIDSREPYELVSEISSIPSSKLPIFFGVGKKSIQEKKLIDREELDRQELGGTLLSSRVWGYDINFSPYRISFEPYMGVLKHRFTKNAEIPSENINFSSLSLSDSKNKETDLSSNVSEIIDINAPGISSSAQAELKSISNEIISKDEGKESLFSIKLSTHKHLHQYLDNDPINKSLNFLSFRQRIFVSTLHSIICLKKINELNGKFLLNIIVNECTKYKSDKIIEFVDAEKDIICMMKTIVASLNHNGKVSLDNIISLGNSKTEENGLIIEKLNYLKELIDTVIFSEDSIILLLKTFYKLYRKVISSRKLQYSNSTFLSDIIFDIYCDNISFNWVGNTIHLSTNSNSTYFAGDSLIGGLLRITSYPCLQNSASLFKVLNIIWKICILHQKIYPEIKEFHYKINSNSLSSFARLLTFHPMSKGVCYFLDKIVKFISRFEYPFKLFLSNAGQITVEKMDVIAIEMISIHHLISKSHSSIVDSATNDRDIDKSNQNIETAGNISSKFMISKSAQIDLPILPIPNFELQLLQILKSIFSASNVLRKNEISSQDKILNHADILKFESIAEFNSILIMNSKIWPLLFECMDMVRDFEGIDTEVNTTSKNSGYQKSHRLFVTPVTIRLFPLIECYFLSLCTRSFFISINKSCDSNSDAQELIQPHAPSNNPQIPLLSASVPQIPLSRESSLPGQRFRLLEGTWANIKIKLEGELLDDLLIFVNQNKIIINSMLRQNIRALETSLLPLIIIPECRKYLDFKVKRAYFKLMIKRMIRLQDDDDDDDDDDGTEIPIEIDRSRVMECSFESFRDFSAKQLIRCHTAVTFVNEEGIDAGGLTREWLNILTKEIFKPNYGLFLPCSDGITFQPNPNSNANPEHLEYFKFIGRVFAKAIFDGHLLDVHFTR